MKTRLFSCEHCIQQGGNRTRHTFLKGHPAIWCGALVGRDKGQDREQQHPEGWGQHLACPHSPSELTSGLVEEVLGKWFTVEWGSCSRIGAGVA